LVYTFIVLVLQWVEVSKDTLSVVNWTAKIVVLPLTLALKH